MKAYLILIILFLVQFSYAATIHGTIYDLELMPLKNAILKVNSEPEQTYVAKEGKYSFNLNPGEYIISITYTNADRYNSKEPISIKDEGDFVYDIILIPDLSEEEELLEEEIEIVDFDDEKPAIWSYVIALFIFIVMFFLLKRKKPKKTELDVELEEEVISFIKKEGNRVTQKEIRKNFNASEAKISLIIKDLEKKGKIEKIKKSKGNIIIIKN